MSGLFLNFYQVDIPTKTVSIDSVEYSSYSSKEAFIALKESFPNLFFYRDNDKFLIWKKNSDAEAKLLTINNLIAENEKNKINPKTQKDTIFSKTIGNFKDEWNKPIKTDADLPVFLVYQLQLGVFKANVLPETFKGLTPIYSKITDNGVCYTTGLFEKLSDAREAKKNVNAMGLTDAFIVAYYNKKKITLPEAVKLEKK